MEEPVKWYEAKVPELIVGAEAGDPDAMYHLARAEHGVRPYLDLGCN
jgi:hypothetical protein